MELDLTDLVDTFPSNIHLTSLGLAAPWSNGVSEQYHAMYPQKSTKSVIAQIRTWYKQTIAMCENLLQYLSLRSELQRNRAVAGALFVNIGLKPGLKNSATQVLFQPRVRIHARRKQ
jgi:hypothetical protein